MKSFQFTTTVFRLNRTKCLDFTHMIQDGELSHDDNVRITYDSKADTLTGVVVENGLQYGHVFEPTSKRSDPELIKEMLTIWGEE